MDVLLFIHRSECLTFKKGFLRSRRGCYSACRTAECLRTVLSEGSISEVWKTSASSPHGPSLTESSACRTEHTQTQRPLWALLRNRGFSCTPMVYRPVCMMPLYCHLVLKLSRYLNCQQFWISEMIHIKESQIKPHA